MQLKVIKKFNGKVEGKVLNPGDVVISKDVKRINALVSGGFCEITSLADPKKDKDADKTADGADGADGANGENGGKKKEE